MKFIGPIRFGRKARVISWMLLILVYLAVAKSSAWAQTPTYTWNGGVGNWSNSTFWNNGVPDSASADVFIDSGKTGTASIVTLDSARTVGRLTLDVGDTFNFNDNTAFSVQNGAFTGSGSIINNGVININSGSNLTDLRFSGAGSISGTGTLNLGGVNGRIFANGVGDRLTIGAGQTIAGAGSLGIGQTTFTNNGTVSANQSGNTLLIQPGGGTADFINSSTGSVQATGGGVLQLSGGSGGVFTNNGTIQALTGSQVLLTNGVTLTGSGLLTNSGGGVITVANSATLSGVTLSGTLGTNDNSTTTLLGTFTNNGTFNVNSGANLTNLSLSGPVTLAGTGTLNLGGVNGRIFANGVGDRLTIAAEATIAGAGSLGIGQTTFTNNGTVSANQSGNTLLIQPGGGTADFTNVGAGITQATGGGTLQLSGASGGILTGGTFQAQDGSQVQLLNGANVINAILATQGTGMVTVLNSATLKDITLSGSLNANDNTVVTLADLLNNNGTFNVNSSANLTDVHLAGPVTLAGTGTLNLGGVNGRIFANGVGDRLTIAAGATIAGAGSLGIGQTTFTNNGTVSANQSGNTLLIQPGGGTADFTNATGATLQSSNSATLQLTGASGGVFTNNGTIQALTGSQVLLTNGVTLTGSGLLTNSGGGVITVANSATLSGVTLSGTLGTNDNSTTTLLGTFTNNGTFNVNSGANLTNLSLSGPVTLAGTGTLNLGGVNGRIFANGVGDRLTIAAGATIAGAGSLGIGQTTFTNNGTVSANQSGNTLLIQPGGGTADFINSSTGSVQATGGGVLQLSGGSGGTFTNNGTIQALDGSQVQLLSGVILTGGGNFSNVGTGTLTVVNTATLSNFTLTGTLGTNDNSTTTLLGTFTNNGTFNVNSGANLTNLSLSGPVTLAGTGTLNLGGVNGRIFANGVGDRLTIAAGATIAGAGSLGIGQTTFTNNGTVSANQSGNTLLIQPGGGTADFINSSTGSVQATGGGVLQLSGGSGGTFTNNGTFAVIASGNVSSTFNVAAGRLTNFSGTTLTGGTYNVLGASSGGTPSNTLAVVSGGNATLSLGGGTITTNAGSVTLSSPSSVFTEINGLTSNTGSFAVANGRNFTTVAALANSGTLIVAGGSTLTITGALTQSSAGLLQGNGTLTAPSFNLSGSIAPGGTVSGTTGVFSNTAGTLLLNGNTTLNPDASIRYQLGAVGTTTSDHLNVMGALTLDGTLYVTALTGFGVGRYDLIDYPVGQLTNNTLDLGTVPSGYNYAIDSTRAGEIDLVVTPVPESEQWTLVPVGAALLVAVRRMIRRETAASRT